MTRLVDNRPKRTRGVSLSQVHHQGRWAWLLEAPADQAGDAALIDEFDNLPAAFGRTQIEAASFERELREQRKADQLASHD